MIDANLRLAVDEYAPRTYARESALAHALADARVFLEKAHKVYNAIKHTNQILPKLTIEIY